MSTHLPDPATSPELFAGVLTRRVVAFCIDTALILSLALVLSVVGLIGGFLTFGLTWLALAFVVPASVVLYYAMTLGSSSRATPGMKMMDIVLTPTRAQPLDGFFAFLHTLVFYVTIWISWPISLLFALFTPRRQMIHDLIVGTLVVRRSPMQARWARGGESAFTAS